MRGRLMLSMMSRMLSRLRLRESADGQDTDHQEDRQELVCGMDHRKTT